MKNISVIHCMIPLLFWNLSYSYAHAEDDITCSTTITSFPYTESFESGWGNWTEVSGTYDIWRRLSGSTSSSFTGPTSAYDGSYYVYTESSSPNYPDKEGTLEGPCFDLSQINQANFQFHYHMYGAQIGTLSFQVNDGVDTTWHTLWERTGEQGNQWLQANVDLSAFIGNTIKVRFYTRTGLSYTGDIAVDKIEVTATAPPSGSACGTTIASFPYAESFESGWGNWTEVVSSNIWRRNSGGTSSGSTGPASAVDGMYYLYTEASSNFNKTAIVEGPCFNLSGQTSANFRFQYNMYGSDMGSLRLEITTNGGSNWSTIWSKSGDAGNNQWYPVNADLTDYVGQTIQLRFRALTGPGFRSDMAIDDLFLSVGSGQVSGNIAGYVGYPSAIGSCSDPAYYACCEFDNLTISDVQNVGFDIRAISSGSIIAFDASDANGDYSATINDGGISISPFVDATNYLNGVSTFDLLLLNRHVNDIQHLQCPIQRIAADVNGDGVINSSDYDDLRAVILSISSSFPAPNWRFLSKAYYNPSLTHPDDRFTADFWNKSVADLGGNEYPFKAKLNVANEQYQYATGDSWTQRLNYWAFDPTGNCYPGNWDFLIFKTGDLDANANYSSFPAPSSGGSSRIADRERVAQSQNLLQEAPLPPLSSRSNKKYEVTIVAKTTVPVEAYQLGIQFDDEILELDKIKPNREYLNATEERNFGQAKKTIRGGSLRTLWVNDFSTDRNGKDFTGDIEIFSFEVKSDAEPEAIKNAFLFDNAIWENFFYGRDGIIEEVGLTVKVRELR